MKFGMQLGIWRLVSNTNNPKNLLEHDLEESIDSISHGILAYEKQSNDESYKKLVALKGLGKLSKKIIYELSELLNIDEMICERIYASWLTTEYRDSSDNLKKIALEQRSRYGLLTRIISFYYTDRMYNHLILKQLISLTAKTERQSNNHLHEIYSGFFEKMKSKSNMTPYKLLMDSFDALYNKKPVESFDSPLRHIMTDQYQSAWCYQILKEQVLVLESLLIHLHYSAVKDQSNLHELVDKFKTRTLTGQAHTDLKPLIEDIHRPLLARLEQLQVMILLVCMNLNVDEQEDNTMNKSSPILEKLDRLFGEQLGDYRSHGPLILGWASLRCGQISADKIGSMGEKALSHDAFSYILNMLSQLEPQELSDQLSAITIYNLMRRVLSLFDDSALDDGEIITRIISQLLRYQSVADAVIQARESDAVYRYILSALHSFPLFFHPVLMMMSSLSQSSKSAAAFVVRLLLNVPTFTEYLDRNSQINLQFISDTELELLEPKLLFGNPDITGIHSLLPTGTIGLTTDSDGPPTVQWHQPFNAWDLLACELIPVSVQLHQVADINIQMRLETNTRLMASTFQHAPITGPASELIHLSIYRIIHGLASLESPSTHTLASCLHLATSLAKFSPGLVIENLAQDYLPVIVGVGQDPTRPWEAEIERSWLGHVIEAECNQCRYPALISTLKLVCTALTSSQSHDQLLRLRLIPTVLYLLQAVLPVHHSWRYADVDERDIMSELCLEMIHSVLNTTSNSVSLSADDKLSLACVQRLLNTTSTGGHVILNMISQFSSDTLSLILLDQTAIKATSCMTREGKPSAVYRLGLCLSLIRRLLIIAQAMKEETVLETCLSAKPANTQQIHINRIIASYTYIRHNTRLAVLSIQLLNTIAQESQMSLMSSFGEDAYSIRAGLLRRLLERAEDPRYKVVVIEFLTTCVVKQPGLLEMLLSEQVPEKKGLLQITLEIVDSERQFTHICPGDLLLSGLNFILALWCSGRQTVTHKLTHSESFWKTVIKPLTVEMGDVSTGSTSHPQKAKIYCNVLQILAYQMYQRLPSDKLKEFHACLSTVTQKQWCDVSQFVHSELRHVMRSSTGDGVMSSLGRRQEDRAQVTDVTLRQSAAVHLLDSYRMFVSTVILSQNKTIFDSGTCQSIMNDVLTNIEEVTSQEVTDINQRLSSMLCSLYHELVSKWFSRSKKTEDTFSDIARVLNRSTNCGSDLSLLPSTITSLVSCLQIIMAKKARTTNLLDTENPYSESLQTVLDCVCTMIPVCCSKITSNIDTGSDIHTDISSLERLRVVLLSALIELMDKLPDSLWISKLHESYVIQSVMYSMSLCINTRTDLLFVETCIVMLINMCGKANRAKLVYTAVSEHLTLSVTSLYVSGGQVSAGVKGHADITGSKSVSKSGTWSSILPHITDIYSMLLSTLAHQFVSHAASYISIHTERIAQLIQTMTNTVCTEELSELRSYIHLIASLSRHEQQWIRESRTHKVTQLMHAAVYLYQDCLLLLKSTQAIQIVKYNHLRTSANPPDSASSIDISAEKMCILDLMAECAHVMKNFTPDLCMLLNDVTLDVMSHDRLIDYGFTHPSLENKPAPSFGSLLSTTMYCVSTLSQNERSTTADADEQDYFMITKPKLFYILETTFYVIMSQAVLYLRSTNQSQHDILRMKREIGSELSICLSGIDRYNRRKNPDSPLARGSGTPASNRSGPMFSTPSLSRSMSSPGAQANIPEIGLFNLAEQFVKKVLK